MRVAAVIPVRYSSTRFPGKPLVPISGKPMIQWVYERTTRAEILDEVLVATDDERILRTVKDFGGRAVLTSGNHRSGTERVVEAACDLTAEIIVNVQGDEPLIQPEMITQAVTPLVQGEEAPIVTLKYPVNEPEELEDLNIVKVVTDKDGYALYFSRLPIPYNRGGAKVNYYKHIGLYVYRREFLEKWGQLKPSVLEKAEQLEQLRALENGYRIKVLPSPYDSWGVDIPEDIDRIYRILQDGRNS